MFSLSAKVKEQFAERVARLSDAELQNHQKVVAFKESIQNSLSQGRAGREKTGKTVWIDVLLDSIQCIQNL